VLHCKKQRYSCQLGYPNAVGGLLHSAHPGTHSSLSYRDRQTKSESRTPEVGSGLAENSWASQVQKASPTEQHTDAGESDTACLLFPV